MRQQASNPTDLIRTEAEAVPPPDVTVPEPEHTPTTESGEGKLDPKLLVEVKSLASRVGGLEKLRELVNVLLRRQRS